MGDEYWKIEVYIIIGGIRKVSLLTGYTLIYNRYASEELINYYGKDFWRREYRNLYHYFMVHKGQR